MSDAHVQRVWHPSDAPVVSIHTDMADWDGTRDTWAPSPRKESRVTFLVHSTYLVFWWYLFIFHFCGLDRMPCDMILEGLTMIPELC